MRPQSLSISDFRGQVLSYYHRYGRDLPWRQVKSDGTIEPYKILVSEIMLQQTQVNRVLPKYEAFLQNFPSIKSLGEASLAEVLKQWVGLGYNRRAKFLWQAAQLITNEYNGQLPTSLIELAKLPGVGPGTAGAIYVYAYNRPAVFIETNIRTVFIHYFFPHKTDINDADLRPLIEASLDRDKPREWYWALMDFGAHLKAQHQNAAVRSRHYTRQSKFAGSKRQLRGQIIKLLAVRPYDPEQLLDALQDKRANSVIDELTTEGFLKRERNRYRLA